MNPLGHFDRTWHKQQQSAGKDNGCNPERGGAKCFHGNHSRMSERTACVENHGDVYIHAVHDISDWECHLET